MSAPEIYQMTDVRKDYGAIAASRIASLQILTGECFCLLGPTGAGKSTLLRLLAGLETPTTGVVSFDGRASNLSELALNERRRIVMVHQQAVLPSGSVAFNVEYGLRIRNADRRQERAHAILKRLGLESLQGRSVRTLSGGETQLVALARALVVEPDVLLLDEPTTHLDPARVVLIEQVVSELRRTHNMTVVWTTHNLFQARRLATRVGLLLDGELVEVAETSSFFERPVDPRTAAFVRGEFVC